MRELTIKDYLEYVSKKNYVKIGGQMIQLSPIKIPRLKPTSNELRDTSTTVWSFPERGGWATHKGDYRGNWPPQIPRTLISMYTKPYDVVLDPMVGSGTTAIEALLLNRHCIFLDICFESVILTLHRIYYLKKYLNPLVWFKAYHGDARNLDKIEDESIDLIATHQPYFNIIKYSTMMEGDLSNAKNLKEYLSMLRDVAKEMFRVLKSGKYCAILIGDTRIHKHYVPISHYVLRIFLEIGFILKEEIIKIQHKMKTTTKYWRKVHKKDFLLIYHEKLLIFRKPGKNEDTTRLRYSMNKI